jgi:hypothetical protein
LFYYKQTEREVITNKIPVTRVDTSINARKPNFMGIEPEPIARGTITVDTTSASWHSPILCFTTNRGRGGALFLVPSLRLTKRSVSWLRT